MREIILVKYGEIILKGLNRNRFEDMIVRQSNRVAAMEAPTKDDLMAVLPEDLEDK